jgi:hypothetical protein
MRLPSTSLLTLSVLSTTLIACGSDDPPTPTEVRTALTDDLSYVLREGEAAMAATDSLPTGSAFGFATVALGDSSDTAGRALAPLTRFIDDMVGDTRTQTQSFDEEQTASDAIVKKLNDELFTNANYLGDGVYRVPASLVCTETTYDPDTGTETTAVNPDCAQKLDEAQLRIRVASEDGGIRFYIQVDANHDEPLAFLLSHTKLAVTVNLDDATAAMQALAPVFGETAPNADMKGQITGAVEIKGAAHAGVSLSFDRAVAIKFADAGIDLDGDTATRFTSAAGKVFALDLDAHATKASMSLGLGATTAHIPGDALDPQATDLALGGATVDASFAGNTLTLANISLGDTQTTLRKGGALAMSVDLNPNDGRSLDATITVDPATGDETLAVSPRLDLRHMVDHAIMGDEAPVYDVTRVLIDGSVRGSALGDRVEILSGSVSVETNPSGYGFSATAGQCVTSTDIYDSQTYTSYTQYSVGSCL